MSCDVNLPKGKIVGSKYVFPVRVYYEDTDAGGVVYYANYLRFAERARTEFLRYLGFGNQQEILEKDRFAFMVRHVEADYRAPAVLDDLLHITCETVEQTGATVTLLQQVKRGDNVLVEIKVKAVYVSLEKRRPIRMPQDLIEKMKLVS
ncbi:MAG: tol-pal system-associated acyl-CoA thioesterase [Alphaproteobacteria bacterium]|nr:tol-pal system-associated acyl-CoA thioesterase [Alphaproteobacteria bacterium]